MKKVNGVLTDVTASDLKLLETSKGWDQFWAGVKTIGTGAFDGEILNKKAPSFPGFTIPENITIQEGAFVNCNFIQEFAFFNCDIKPGAFQKCKFESLKFIGDKSAIVSSQAFLDCCPVNSIYLYGKNIPNLDFVDKIKREIFGIIYVNEENQSLVINKLMNMIDPRALVNIKFNNLKIIDNLIYEYGLTDYRDFIIKFCYHIGCFDKQKYSLDANKENFPDKATGMMVKLIKNYLGNDPDVLYHEINNLGFLVKSGNKVVKSENLNKFLKFITDPSNYYKNFNDFFNTIPELNQNKDTNKEIRDYVDLINNFSNIVDNKGNLTYEQALDRYALFNYSKDKKDEYNVFEKLEKNNIYVGKEEYDMLVEVVKQQKKAKIKEHILDTPLKGKGQRNTARDRIETLINQTQTELNKGLNNVEFTYEMLSKHDLINAFVGRFKTDCCCQLNYGYYGEDIAVATMLAPDVQNMVVRDNSGDIIAKAAMYVDEKNGKILLNEFDINKKYKKAKEQLRDEIFSTFMTGLEDFVEKYNQTHSVKIKQVNVGAGNSKLLSQSEKFEPCGPRDYKFIKTPKEYTVSCKDNGKQQEDSYKYNFMDTDEEQFVLLKYDYENKNTAKPDEKLTHKINNPVMKDSKSK